MMLYGQISCESEETSATRYSNPEFLDVRKSLEIQTAQIFSNVLLTVYYKKCEV